MGKTAFIFSGQGAQYVGMGKDLYDNFPAARKVFDEADEVTDGRISKMCFEGPKEILQETVNTQPAILTHSVACYSVLKENGILPDVVAGLSLGEYSALVASEALEFRQAVPLVQKRGKFMQEAVPIGKGTMAAIIGLEREQVLEICKMASAEGVVEAANFNCPGQIVVAGEVEAVNKAINLAKAKGAKKAVLLAVSAPFHCSLLKPAADNLAKELEKVVIKDTKIPVVSNVNADFAREGQQVKELLVKQVNSPVLWEDCIKKMIDSGVDTFVEVGPGKVLSGFVKKIDKTLKVTNVEDTESLYNTIKNLGG
ncbi:ACP S-malonyltransferase [Tepidanaerobacter sp. GT38]|uniref:ACP S-malonyltransferase n=1 Tax=Tepidanaerobacter sp. GT38 TaxID=2722793 RepID=UPI001F01F47F|nr:ACP S-malonyltransferase [Tepidanaerobacter sp. GT38]MCG1012871.1 ACP S-malonyltransferase [Tepidanaerobacter sp. GT38]